MELPLSDSIRLRFGEEEVSFTELLRSLAHDVVKVHAHTHKVGVLAEYQWIKQRYPQSTVIRQTLTTLDIIKERPEPSPRQIFFDVIQIELKNGREKDVYFDISSFFDGEGTSHLDPEGFIARKIAELYG